MAALGSTTEVSHLISINWIPLNWQQGVFEWVEMEISSC